MKINKTAIRRAVLVPLLVLAALVCGAADNSGAAVEWDKRSHDFGNVAENGGPVRTDFVFTNTGTQPLVIVSATASCGCTRPKFPVEPIKPGKSGTLTVTYLPQGRPGEFDKEVRVRTNAANCKKITLRIKGVVVPGQGK